MVFVNLDGVVNLVFYFVIKYGFDMGFEWIVEGGGGLVFWGWNIGVFGVVEVCWWV